MAENERDKIRNKGKKKASMKKISDKKISQLTDNGIPYVVSRNGETMFHTSESMRYSPDIELDMLESGYVITISGKKLTKKAVQERIRFVQN